MSEELDKSIKKNAVPVGLILGVIVTVISILSFYVMTSTTSIILISAAPIVLSVIIPIILAVIYSKQLRTKIGGFWNFRQATSGIFIMLLISFAVQFVVRDMVFAKVIEPDMVSKMEVSMTTAVSQMLEKSKASQEAIDKQIDKIQKSFDEQKTPTIGKQVQAVAITIIFLFVLALILAAFLKKENHTFNLNDELESEPTV
ncbi:MULTISPECIES: DUF4199 domain-containing protein [unclassified Mucilaginibacter]|uniref:DUF4199 domain-containing protein n=1 Tax=unclassified Mucilaginibacter TaxID=2617802 RepID=UPI002AC98669|nr:MULTISPECIES: DUF4199 domain-containing protein [unclassified Mucilaginibacter]MEB0260403.1 DUF4199 domain-containing protein [Mucilaginibacter sp. 10I4]MEB0279442.1 DUF4199 domain-containing protein [Mucilaginibacter sp. 10B2]MEB0300003.1 DUF4199 domain-containing protein [Mucilaginibacter sp. 5C4]WPX21817.1 DUF4199 domain-containing protein [Mucilaginibacter sp. 5C4]